MSIYSVTFDGTDLSTLSGVDLYNHDTNKLPTRQININKIARKDLSIVTSAEYVSKEITVYLDVCSSTRAGTEATLASIKGYITKPNGLLVISQGGNDIEYTATMNEFSVSWLGPQAVVTIVFIASTPIGKQSTSVLLNSLPNITTSTTSQALTVTGSAVAYPVITVSITTVTGATNKSIILENRLIGQGITVTRTWANLDVLVVDSLNLTATVNGGAVDFTGVFPQFDVGAGQLNYTDNFTTRNVALTSYYQPRLV